MGYKSKKYEDLFFTDDFLFSKIMRKPEIAKGVVESLLGIKVGRIEFLTSQYSLNEVYGEHGVRLDAYLEDSDKVIDIEMQTVVKSDEGLRMRYYQSVIDVEHLSCGESYRRMKESYVIFICLADPFGDGKPVYSFVTREEDGDRILNDRIHKVIYNASDFAKAGSPAVRSFLKYLKNRSASDAITRRIQTEVEVCKSHQKWRAEYMLWNDQVREWKEEAREEGLAEGREEGREIGRAEGREEGRMEGRTSGIAEGKKENAVETARNLLKLNILTDSQIAQATQLTVEQVVALKTNSSC